jgi:sarcosine oxidase
MPAPIYDSIVVGVGGMGSAACWHLAQRGQRVLGLERFQIGHAMGSSHGMTRIIRLAYFEGSHYVPLVRRAHQLWQETGARAGLQLLHVTGSMDMAPEGAGPCESSRQSCLDHGLKHELLDNRALQARMPGFALPKQTIGLWQEDGGFVASELAIYAHVGLAQAAGATIRTGVEVLGWEPTAAGGARVTTTQGVFEAGQLILTAGPWMGEVAPSLKPHLSTVRQVITWFTAREAAAYAMGQLPVYILTVEEGNFYGFPIWQHPGVKLGGPHFGRQPIDPNSPERQPGPNQVELQQAFVRRYMPGLSDQVLSSHACIYTVTPDDHFIIDHAPGHPQVLMASCCSGHGYKFAAAIGEVLADLAIDRRTAFDIAPFSISRLATAA